MIPAVARRAADVRNSRITGYRALLPRFRKRSANREYAMKHLMVVAAALAVLSACSWHPSNNGPARDTAGPPTSGYVAPNGYVAPPPR